MRFAYTSERAYFGNRDSTENALSQSGEQLHRHVFLEFTRGPGRKKALQNHHFDGETIHITRWLAPTAQDVALHALVCLLRAVEVDVCGRGSNTDDLDAAGRVASINAEREGQAMVMEEGVLSLVLRACSVFQNQAEVVKACCMLMRVGVQCSLPCGGTEVGTQGEGNQLC